MTIEELIDRYYASGTFNVSLYESGNSAEHIGDFKNDSIGIKAYLKYKISLWYFGETDNSLILFIKEENKA